ncbi:MAG: hypothetical protein JWR68_94 [Polaromonas sp.]|nr:hypothetical protein [Polaromonas sp.]
MRIISFSNASTQPFWSASVQALAPWLTHFKNSLGRASVSSSIRPVAAMGQRQSLAHQTPAANDPMAFAGEPAEPAVRPQSVKKNLPRGNLRVVRESDSAISSDCAGRMVISGRMADVCAELDRMAALQTTEVQ